MQVRFIVIAQLKYPTIVPQKFKLKFIWNVQTTMVSTLKWFSAGWNFDHALSVLRQCVKKKNYGVSRSAVCVKVCRCVSVKSSNSAGKRVSRLIKQKPPRVLFTRGREVKKSNKMFRHVTIAVTGQLIKRRTHKNEFNFGASFSKTNELVQV